MYAVPRTQVKARVDELLAAFDLTARAGDKVGGFSKGMRQRMALARTILHNPELVFLDEPTSGLDPAAIREVHQLIERLRDQGHTVFLATHNLNEAERLCDRVAVLARGKVLAMGGTRELAQQLEHGHRMLVEVDCRPGRSGCPGRGDGSACDAGGGRGRAEQLGRRTPACWCTGPDVNRRRNWSRRWWRRRSRSTVSNRTSRPWKMSTLPWSTSEDTEFLQETRCLRILEHE